MISCCYSKLFLVFFSLFSDRKRELAASSIMTIIVRRGHTMDAAECGAPRRPAIAVVFPSRSQFVPISQRPPAAQWCCATRPATQHPLCPSPGSLPSSNTHTHTHTHTHTNSPSHPMSHCSLARTHTFAGTPTKKCPDLLAARPRCLANQDVQTEPQT